MDDGLKDFITFTASERRGIIVLVVLSILLAFLNQYLPRRVGRYEAARFEREWKSYLSAYALSDSSSADDQHAIVDSQAVRSVQINNLDQREGELTPSGKNDNDKAVARPVDINEASAADLASIPGMPGYMASRIVSFRESLGGFVDIRQIKDVYGMNEELFERVSPYFLLNRGRPRQLMVNLLSEDQLLEHPYIGPALARQIVNFREKVRLFERPEDIYDLYLVDSILGKKLIPYVSCDMNLK